MRLLGLRADIADDWCAGWVRFGEHGCGLRWTNREPLFSERYGTRKPFARAFGFRWFWVRGTAR